MLISSDGTVFPEARYGDICYELNYVRVAANYDDDTFEMHNKTGFYDFVRYPVTPLTGDSSIAYEYELLDAFYLQFNVIPIISDMNYTWGWYDNETELWTGGVGAVITSPKSQLSPKSCLSVCLQGIFCSWEIRRRGLMGALKRAFKGAYKELYREPQRELKREIQKKLKKDP